MNEFANKLVVLEEQIIINFDSSVHQDEEDNDIEYVKIRSDVLALYAKAKNELSGKELAVFKTSVIEFLCRNCGCHLDMKVLDTYTPHILSEEDMEYILHNSALARWF